MTSSTEVLSEELRVLFSGLAATARAKGWRKDSEWTIGINDLVAEIGQRYGYRVCASRCSKSAGHEWVYDHHWQELSENNEITSLPLAMEIEWGFGRADLKERILDDFYKLVQAKTGLRVLVFQYGQVASLFDDLERRFRGFRLTTGGDRVLLVGYSYGTDKVDVRLVVV
jgi:hypothetical protein